MFSGVKKKAAAAIAVPALAFSLAGGMALQEAAPAEAFIIPLVPIAGAVIGWGGIGTVSAGGIAAGAGFLGVIGLGMWASQPDQSIELPDWFDKEPESTLRPGRDASGNPVEKVVKTPKAVTLDPGGSATPAQSGYIHDHEKVAVEVGPKFEIGGGGWQQITVGFKHLGGMPGTGSDRSLHYFFPTVYRETECLNVNTNARYTRKGVYVGAAMYQPSSLHTQPQTHSVGFSCNDGSQANTAANTRVLRFTMRAATTAEKVAHGGQTMADNQGYKGPLGDFAWVSPNYATNGVEQYRTEVQCRASDGKLTTISTSTPVGQKSLKVPSCSAAGLGSPVRIGSGLADGDTIKQPLFTATPTDPMLDCDVALGQVCKMEVWIDGMPCSMGNTACQSWAGLYRVASYRVECRYGGKVVDISGCGVLEGAYVHGGSPAISTNIDGNPDTWTDPASVPNWQPQRPTESGPQVDPEWSVGAPQPAPNPSPAPDVTTAPQPKPSTPTNPQPSTSPQPSTQPTTGPNPNPNPDAPVAPRPETPTNPQGDPGPNEENCLEAAVSWNPIDWVLVPVKCALVWAFVPSETVVTTAVDLVRPKVERIGITPLIDVWGTSIDAIPKGGGGCSGPALDLAVINLDTYYPFSACAEPMAGIATGVNAFFGIGLVFSGCVSVIRAAGAAFGFNFSQGVGAGEK